MDTDDDFEQLANEMSVAIDPDHRLRLMQRAYRMLCSRTGRKPDHSVSSGDPSVIAGHILCMTREVVFKHLDS